jgi:DNA repair protein REV1
LDELGKPYLNAETEDSGALCHFNSLAMPVQLVATQSASSDYFEPEDPEFIDALQASVLPGDIPESQLVVPPPAQEQAESEWAQVVLAGQPSLKRSHSTMAEEDSDDMVSENSDVPVNDEDPTDDTYGASRFGEFGNYMRRKRAKLQIQNDQMLGSSKDDASGEIRSRIFQGIAIYVRFPGL